MGELPVWAQGGIAGLALATLVYIFVGMRTLMRDLLREFMDWAGNHMSHSAEVMENATKAQVETARAMANVADALDGLKEEVHRLSEKV